jgi:hypothetical protein
MESLKKMSAPDNFSMHLNLRHTLRGSEYRLKIFRETKDFHGPRMDKLQVASWGGGGIP